MLLPWREGEIKVPGQITKNAGPEATGIIKFGVNRRKIGGIRPLRGR